MNDEQYRRLAHQAAQISGFTSSHALRRLARGCGAGFVFLRFWRPPPRLDFCLQVEWDLQARRTPAWGAETQCITETV